MRTRLATTILRSSNLLLIAFAFGVRPVSADSPAIESKLGPVLPENIKLIGSRYPVQRRH